MSIKRALTKLSTIATKHASAVNQGRQHGCRLFFAVLLLLSHQCVAANTLWRIETGDSTVFLLGSVHLLQASDYPLPDALNKAYLDADSLLLEIDLDDLSALHAARVIRNKATAAPGTSLRTLLGEDKYAEADRLARAASIELRRFESSEPWHVALEVTREAMLAAGYASHLGVDQHFAQRAMADGKPIEGLERFEQQIAFFDELPLELQSRLLLQALKEIGNYSGQLDALVTAWREGNTEELASELEESFVDYPKLREVLVNQRNNDWITPIEALTERPGTSLVIVGALHLVGEDSLIDLLAARGLQPRRVLSDRL